MKSVKEFTADSKVPSCSCNKNYVYSGSELMNNVSKNQTSAFFTLFILNSLLFSLIPICPDGENEGRKFR